MQMVGISDLIGVWRGRFTAIEVKLPDNTRGMTPTQRLFIRKVNEAGGLGFEARSIDEVKEKLNELGI